MQNIIPTALLADLCAQYRAVYPQHAGAIMPENAEVYDLVAPAKAIVPITTALLNRLPRVPRDLSPAPLPRPYVLAHMHYPAKGEDLAHAFAHLIFSMKRHEETHLRAAPETPTWISVETDYAGIAFPLSEEPIHRTLCVILVRETFMTGEPAGLLSIA